MTPTNDSIPEDDRPVVVSVKGLEKRFKRENGEWTAAIDGVSIDIHAGELVVLLGSSGCGKTTTLRCIAGLESPTGGEISSNGAVISSAAKGVVVAPEKRNFGMMFQSYAVWPHMSVFGNVAYPLKSRHISRDEVARRVGEALEMVGIGHLQDEYPAQLSGGQQQRVALARCLVADPQVILFDEPLSNVDAKVREGLRTAILAMKERIGFGGLYVTHDQEEAMGVADRIAVMHEGRIVQVGTPREIYNEPNSLLVAHFVGTINRWPGTVKTLDGPDGRLVITSSIGDVVVDATRAPVDLSVGQTVWVIVRPEDLSLSDEAMGGSANSWSAKVLKETFRGESSQYRVEVGDLKLRVRGTNTKRFGEGEVMSIGAQPDRVRVLATHDTDEAVKQ